MHPLSNPCIDDETYRRWLWSKIKNDNLEVIEALINYDPTCWCASNCHCAVIKRAVNWINTLSTVDRLWFLCNVAGFEVVHKSTTTINGQVVQCPEWRATLVGNGRKFVTIVHRAVKPHSNREWTIEYENGAFSLPEDELSEWMKIILRRRGDDTIKHMWTDIPNKKAEKRRKRLRKLGFIKP